MIFRNEVKYNMYRFLLSLKKSHDYKKTYQELSLKIENSNLDYVIAECVDNHFIDGITYSKGKLENDIYLHCSNKIYLTSTGCEFIKNYYSYIFKLLRDIFLIFVTAIVTVLITNKFSVSNQDINLTCHIASQDGSSIIVCNNSDN